MNRVDTPAQLLAGLNNDGMVTLKEALDRPEVRSYAALLFSALFMVYVLFTCFYCAVLFVHPFSPYF